MSKEEFLFCPLGGSGEIGMNLNLYAFGKEDNHKWIAVDMGVTFADDSIPGIDLIFDIFYTISYALFYVKVFSKNNGKKCDVFIDTKSKYFVLNPTKSLIK